MKRISGILMAALTLALPGRAEFLQTDISIFGMD
jgi:hypothetical protein